MKIVSDCFNFVTTMLSYHIKFINVLDTHVYFIYVYPTVAAPRFWFGGRGNIRQTFIHEFLSSPVLQWRRQNFGSEKTARMYSSKTFEKNFEKFIKQFAQKFEKFSKIFLKNII